MSSRNKCKSVNLVCRLHRVNKDEVVKIADFGLARDIYDKDYYKSGAGDPLPIKWLAIEVLEGQGHSTQSDVVRRDLLL